MTYQNSPMAHGARQLKAVAAVVALFALTLAGLTIALAPSEARPEALLVAVGTFGIAIFMWAYAARPSLFTGDPDGVFGDPLRTSYSVPERSRLASVREHAALGTSHANASSSVPVTEHTYVWQSVRRVAPGERIWTAAYVRLLARHVLLAVAAMLGAGALIAGVVLGLGESVGPMWFVAAAIILPLGFAMSHRSGLVDVRDYPTATMAPLPDLTWRPAPLPASAVATDGQGETYAA